MLNSDEITVTDEMQMKEKLEKASGNLLVDLFIIAASTILLITNAVIYFMNPEYRAAISYAVFVSVIAELICNFELSNSINTLRRIRECSEPSEAKLIEVKRMTLPYFNAGICLLSLTGTIIILNGL
ncbi:TPA: hypothetical protein ACJXXT_000169 [Pseudomonas aeruginosa]